MEFYFSTCPSETFPVLAAPFLTNASSVENSFML